MSKKEIKINGIYKHYKGNIYKVLVIGRHSETGEEMVIYQSLKNGEVWCRPKNMWFDEVAEGIERFSLCE